MNSSTKTLAVLRFSMAALFLWFGTQQLVDAGAWVGFLPQWTGYLPVPGEMFVRLNGLLEVIGAALLIIGAGTRVIATILGLHLLAIAASAGGAVGVRDAALGACAIALSLSPADRLTVDARSAGTAKPG